MDMVIGRGLDMLKGRGLAILIGRGPGVSERGGGGDNCVIVFGTLR